MHVVPFGHVNAKWKSPSAPHVCTSCPLHTASFGAQRHTPALHGAPPVHAIVSKPEPSLRHRFTKLAPSQVLGADGSQTWGAASPSPAESDEPPLSVGSFDPPLAPQAQ